ncbi:glycosyltransferase family 4 protein [Streptococcus uberis]|uniref:glycosyltransferase family 4 protein n=1 Tax=Streptococcus uberis TaxID=1349 RepID=UPI001FF5CFEC|nr:glycosyltransferase family 4 protein [Streptococcus uberis]MCK1215801.1 glycosyltransferase family 4 protein [Streptococcus uberis]
MIDKKRIGIESNMKVLIFSAYYEPEITASLYITKNLFEDIAKSGCEVSLYVPIPTRGVDDEIRKIYSTTKKEESLISDRLKIHRISLPREGKGAIGRALRYLLMNALFVFKSFKENPDVIFVQSTPPTQGAMAILIKKMKKVPFVYNLQDVFPDSLVGAGITSNSSLLYKVGKVIENYTYKNSDNIIVISEDMKNNLLNKNVPESKISVISNWINSDQIKPIVKKDNYLFDKFKISRDKFTVVYAGNLGYAQNIEVILEAAKKLQDNPDIQFVIFGNGNQEDNYKDMAKEMHLSNVVFFPLQPYSEVSYVYSLGDVSILPCKKGFGGSAMPSKTWSILATGTPIIASFDTGTQIQSIIEKNELGLFGEADDVDILANNILDLYFNSEFRKKSSINARKYIENNVSREKCTSEYIKVIHQVVK